MPTPLPASPPDFTGLATNAGLVLAAVAAVFAGWRKGKTEIRAGGADTGTELAAGLIVDGNSLRNLIDSNRKLCEANHETLDLLKSIDRSTERLVEALKDHRETTRSQQEEQHRLRAATVDLSEVMRRRL